jgi:hypothetical protein
MLLLGIGVTDLAFSARPGRWAPQVLGAAVVVAAGQAWGMTTGPDAAATMLLVLTVLAWGSAVTRGFGRGPAWWPLALFALAVVLTVLAAPMAGEPGGPVARWLASDAVGPFAGMDPERAALLLGFFAVQLSTGNVLVRLVLATTGTVNPVKADARRAEGPSGSLKGGRLLGPMERVFILGLGLAGQLTAASIVVAAKGLLRFPELQAARDPDDEGPGIHAVTEYFLVGSFASWLVALGSLALLLG